MIVTNGQNFDESMVSWSSLQLCKQPYSGRTVIGLIPGNSYGGFDFGCTAGNGKDYGGASASTDTPTVALHGRLIVAFESFTNLAAGTSSTMFYQKFGDSHFANIRGWVYFSVYNNSGTYELYANIEQADGEFTNVYLRDVVAGGDNFYMPEYLAFKDKILLFVDRVYVDEVALDSPTDTIVFAEGTVSINTNDGPNWVLDFLSEVRHEVSLTTSLDRMLTDYVPANGELYLIKAADLFTMIADEDAYDVAITAGELAAETAVDGDYLLVQIPNDLILGCAVKLEKATTWAKSNWSIT